MKDSFLHMGSGLAAITFLIIFALWPPPGRSTDGLQIYTPYGTNLKKMEVPRPKKEVPIIREQGPRYHDRDEGTIIYV